jgi:hypothetical protein
MGTSYAPQRFWPLVLTKSARALTVVFIVIGALGYVASQAIHPVKFNVNSIESSIARSQVEDAYSALSAATQTFKGATQTCTASSTTSSEELQCLEGADIAWEQSIRNYRTTITNIAYPDSAQSEANAAVAAASRAEQVVASLAASPDAASYSAASNSAVFRSTLDAVDTTYNELVDALTT